MIELPSFLIAVVNSWPHLGMIIFANFVFFGTQFSMEEYGPLRPPALIKLYNILCIWVIVLLQVNFILCLGFSFARNLVGLDTFVAEPDYLYTSILVLITTVVGAAIGILIESSTRSSLNQMWEWLIYNLFSSKDKI